MFIDEVKITLKAGHGGAGKVSFYKVHQKGPDGGNGGKGGDIYLQATSDLTALSKFSAQKFLSAQDGKPGGSNKKSGENGRDLTLTIPVGSHIKDLESGEIIELKTPDQVILICKGGLGGKGNYELRSSRNTTPISAQPGLMGQEKDLEINLKLIADLGLIGLPNAGKSSLLNELSNSHSKVANYPFTTLEPNLGVFNSRSNQFKKIIADIPGLIEGASQGKGLGIKFLKHIEKVAVLIHLISAESQDPLLDYETLRNELKSYSPSLLAKKELIILTKSDLIPQPELLKKIDQLKKVSKIALAVSIYDFKSIEHLKKILSLKKTYT